MEALLHTAIVLATVFFSFCFGLFRGYMRGLDEGISEGSAIALKQTLEYMRSKHDIHITDYDIRLASEYLRDNK